MFTARQHITEAERLLAESKARNPNEAGAATLAAQANIHVQLAAIILAIEVSRGARATVLDANERGGES